MISIWGIIVENQVKKKYFPLRLKHNVEYQFYFAVHSSLHSW